MDLATSLLRVPSVQPFRERGLCPGEKPGPEVWPGPWRSCSRSAPAQRGHRQRPPARFKHNARCGCAEKRPLGKNKGRQKPLEGECYPLHKKKTISAATRHGSPRRTRDKTRGVSRGWRWRARSAEGAPPPPSCGDTLPGPRSPWLTRRCRSHTGTAAASCSLAAVPPSLRRELAKRSVAWQRRRPAGERPPPASVRRQAAEGGAGAGFRVRAARRRQGTGPRWRLAGGGARGALPPPPPRLVPSAPARVTPLARAVVPGVRCAAAPSRGTGLWGGCARPKPRRVRSSPGGSCGRRRCPLRGAGGEAGRGKQPPRLCGLGVKREVVPVRAPAGAGRRGRWAGGEAVRRPGERRPCSVHRCWCPTCGTGAFCGRW